VVAALLDEQSSGPGTGQEVDRRQRHRRCLICVDGGCDRETLAALRSCSTPLGHAELAPHPGEMTWDGVLTSPRRAGSSTSRRLGTE
jgi:hypothetical protein